MYRCQLASARAPGDYIIFLFFFAQFLTFRSGAVILIMIKFGLNTVPMPTAWTDGSHSLVIYPPKSLSEGLKFTGKKETKLFFLPNPEQELDRNKIQDIMKIKRTHASVSGYVP